MAQISTSDFRPGVKVEMDGQPFNIVANEFVKPGKGQAFNRVKLKNLKNGRVVEKTFKSGEKLDRADVDETAMRMLYTETDCAVFMNDKTYDQVEIQLEAIGDAQKWLLEDTLYDVVFWRGDAVSVEAPTFMNLKVTETAPGARGDTASGRVLKPATVETGAQIQVPIFIDEEEVVKVDTRDGSYVSRATE